MTVQTPISIHPDAQTVTEVRHWTDTLFSFRVTRPRSLRFRSGEFAMIGLLKDNGKPLLRAYSIASPSWDETLEFYSIKVPDGPLTSRLQHIAINDQVIVRPKVTGTLILDALTPAKRLWLLATGTGIAPFASILRDPDTYERYDQVILTHTCRTVAELAYGQELIEGLPHDPLIGEHIADKLLYYPTTTREPFLNEGRITDLMRTGKVFSDLGVPTLDRASDRVMICGSMGLNLEIKDILAEHEFNEGSVNRPGDFVLEKAFVG